MVRSHRAPLVGVFAAALIGLTACGGASARPHPHPPARSFLP